MRAWLIERQSGLACLRTRRSVRRFRSDPVPGNLINQILEAATWAPSAHHRQPWRFAVLTGEQVKANLAEAMGAAFLADLTRDGVSVEKAHEQVDRSRLRLNEAPAVIILCCDSTTGDIYPDAARQQSEYLMAIQGVAMAGQNLLLAAAALGLGAVWLCSPLFAPEAIREVLALPHEWEPEGMVLLGYPDAQPPDRPRVPPEEVTRYFTE
jgi:F420 biosynthesis protein FbiB-like protein